MKKVTELGFSDTTGNLVISAILSLKSIPLFLFVQNV